jgi:hypothetical protein
MEQVDPVIHELRCSYPGRDRPRERHKIRWVVDKAVSGLCITNVVTRLHLCVS